MANSEYNLTVVDGTALTISLSGPAGPAGATGPAGIISTSTLTTLTGYIYGNGTTIAGATTATSANTANTLVKRDEYGIADFSSLRIANDDSGLVPISCSGGVFSFGYAVQIDPATKMLQLSGGGIFQYTFPNADGKVPVYTGAAAVGKVLTSSGTNGAATWETPAGGTVDATIIDGSTNAVSGNAVFDALALKAPKASPEFTGTLTSTTSTSQAEAIIGNSTSGYGVSGISVSSYGVSGISGSNFGVFADSTSGVGINASTVEGTYHATFGFEGIDQSFVARDKGAFGWIRGSFTGRIHPPDTLTADRTYTLPDDTGTVALTNPSTGTQTFSGTQIFTTRPTSSGSGTPEATSLITRADAVDEIIFNMARIQRSDHAQAYTANGGTSSLLDGDNINTGTAANNRPVCVRYRQINRFGSGANAAVCPIRIASYGCYGHGATGNVDSKIRCGIGMALGASIPAANANALAGRGFGWEIYWDGTNIVFGLFAHNGTTYVTTDGASGRSAAIATGQNPANFDGFFHIIVGLSAGVVSAWTVFTNSPVAPMRVSGTPTLTLAGGPTTGNNFVTSGVQWACVNHSTNTPTQSTSMKVLDRLLIMD